MKPTDPTGGLFWSNCLCGTKFSLIEHWPVAGADGESKSPRKIHSRAIAAGFIQFRGGETGSVKERTSDRDERDLRHHAGLVRVRSQFDCPLFVAQAELAISHPHCAAGRDEERN